MGVTAYLEVYGAGSFDPGSHGGRVLFASKGLLPPAAPAGIWLPQGGQQLIRARPSVHVRSWSPGLPLQPNAPMTLDEHAKRLANWTTPPFAKLLPGPRYDNGYA